MTWRTALALLALIGFGCGCIEIGKDLKQGQWDAARLAEAKAQADALQAAAREIAKLDTSAQVIKERVIRETVDRPVYRDCAHSDSVLNDINAAITGQSAIHGELPASGPSD